jgi:hypothetical protein
MSFLIHISEYPTFLSILVFVRLNALWLLAMLAITHILILVSSSVCTFIRWLLLLRYHIIRLLYILLFMHFSLLILWICLFLCCLLRKEGVVLHWNVILTVRWYWCIVNWFLKASILWELLRNHCLLLILHWEVWISIQFKTNL